MQALKCIRHAQFKISSALLTKHYWLEASYYQLTVERSLSLIRIKEAVKVHVKLSNYLLIIYI